MKITITAVQTPNGWKLQDSNGNDAQEGYEYPTRAEALKAAAQIWPTNSVWHGRKTAAGWEIDGDAPDF